MQEQSFLLALDEVFNLESGAITSNAVLQEIDGWDSLTFMSLLMMIDKKCHASLAPGDVLKCVTVRDLIALLGNEITPMVKAA